jgi:hypothetical protein
MRQKEQYQPPSQYNAYLAGWAFAFSVVLVTCLFLSWRGRV